MCSVPKVSIAPKKLYNYGHISGGDIGGNDGGTVVISIILLMVNSRMLSAGCRIQYNGEGACLAEAYLSPNEGTNLK